METLLNDAVQVLAPLMVTLPSTQSGSPDHPENAEPAVGVGIIFTIVFWANSAEQVEPQSIVPGVVLTLPVPFPANATVRPKATGRNDAAQARLPVIVT